MAEIRGFGSVESQSYYLYVWNDLNASDTGSPITIAGWPDRSVQLVGSGPITIEGSMDGTTWGVLSDAAGNDLVLEDNKPRVIGPNVVYIRPRATGSGSIYIVASRG